MSDGALDLSISSYEVSTQRHAPRTHDPVSSDSGRASSDSTSSDIHEDVKSRFRPSPPPRLLSSPSSGALPPPTANSAVGILSQQDLSSNNNSNNNNSNSNNNNTHHLGPSPHSPRSPMSFSPSPARLRNLLPPSQPQQQHQQQQQPTALSPQHPHTTFSSNARSASPTIPRAGDSGRLSNPNSPEASASSSLPEEELKSLPFSSQSERAGSDPRVAPIRPFKMYPVDAFNVYNSQLMPGSGGGLSPSPIGIQSLYDSASPSNFPSFPLTPLTSHLLQRKRRAELRDNSSNPTSGSVKSESGSPVGIVNSSSPIFGNTGVSTTLTANEPPSTRGSCSSDGQENETDLEKKAKIIPDEKKDEAYWDRRRKNNEAAKRSRDARRQKEEEIAMRAAFLEQENLKLRAQVAILKNETAKLHYMLYNRI